MGSLYPHEKIRCRRYASDVVGIISDEISFDYTFSSSIDL